MKFSTDLELELPVSVEADIEPGTDEHIPRHDRPDLYEPSTAATVTRVSLHIGGIDITKALPPDVRAEVEEIIRDVYEAHYV